MPSPRSTQALITRAISSCQERGMTVARVDVSPDGTVRVFDVNYPADVPSQKEGKTCDELFGVAPS